MKANQKNSFITFTIILLFSIYTLIVSNNKIEQLQECIYNCDYEKAIKLADVLLRSSRLSKEDRANVYINKGIAEYSSNRILDSRITFSKLLDFDQKTNLDPEKISPKIIKLFNNLKNRIEQNHKVKIWRQLDHYFSFYF